MAKNNITQYDATAANNTDIDSINIDEGMAASDVNNALRSLMSHLKNVDTGSQALTALSVAGDLTIAQKIVHSGDTDTHIALADNQIDLTVGDVNIFQGVSNEVVINQGSADVNFRVESNGNANMLVVDGGNDQVGIGTSSPQRQLHIAGGSNTGLKISGNNSGATSSDGFDIFVRDDNSGVELVQRENEFMSFHTNNTERMRIRSGGFVAINTTGGSAQFQVLASSGDIVYFQNSSGTGAKLTAGNQSFSAVSDENKKENIVELDKQQSYDNIKNIRAVTYKFKDIEVTGDDGKKTTYEDDKSRIGFIAQDWETKYSQLVNTDDDGVKSLLYTETTPVLLSALQKAQEKIEALEARITALEKA